MARKRESFFEMHYHDAGVVSVVLAVLIYVGMRWILPSIEFPNFMLKSLAPATPKAAWFFALLFLIPALVSFVKRTQRREVLGGKFNRLARAGDGCGGRCRDSFDAGRPSP